jgi:hypothetical protein
LGIIKKVITLILIKFGYLLYFDDDDKNIAFIYNWLPNKNKWYITGSSWKIVGYILEIIDVKNTEIKNKEIKNSMNPLFNNDIINNSSDELSDEYHKTIKKSENLLKKEDKKEDKKDDKKEDKKEDKKDDKKEDKKEIKELRSENIRLKLKKSILEKLYHINNLHDLKYIDIFISSLIQIEYAN